MGDEPRTEEISPEELEAQTAEELPDREAMSTVDLGEPPVFTLPVDPPEIS